MHEARRRVEACRHDPSDAGSPVCYHPLFLFTDHGDCVAAKLRPGNVSSAEDWAELLVPEIDRQQARGQRVAFRADAAFARPAIYEALEARGVGYAIRIPANKNLELAIEDILFRSPGRPSRKATAAAASDYAKQMNKQLTQEQEQRVAEFINDLGSYSAITADDRRVRVEALMTAFAA